MASDPAWPMQFSQAQRVVDLLAYIDDPNGLIGDDVPHVGLLDDALLVDIAMDTLRDELDGYAEFCRYRQSEFARRGNAHDGADINRAHWQDARDTELRLEQHLHRVRGSSYSGSSAAERVFRVC